MKEASWNDCIETSSALKAFPNKERAISLMETANERISIIKEINEKNCNFVFEDYYSSVLELLQAMVILKGYKVGNHICIGYYLRDVMKRQDIFMAFDDLRYKRNSLTYYGKMMDFDIAKHAIDKCKMLIKEINILLK